MQEDKLVELHVSLTKNQGHDIDVYAEDLEAYKGGKIQFDFENEPVGADGYEPDKVEKFVEELANLKVSFFKARFTMVRGQTL